MINHRGPEFAQILNNVTAGLKKVFQTNNNVVTLTSSGTGGLEAAVVNMLSPGDKVLAVSIGVFGDRFAKIAKTYGARLFPEFRMGKSCRSRRNP
jgi:aspartate aminotransferase-like enzyme